MVNKVLRLFSIFAAVLSASVLIIMNSASAEDDTVCSGMIVGQTNSGNSNAGVTYFDSHSTNFASTDPVAGWDHIGSYYVDTEDTGLVPLDIMLGYGIYGNAPVFREYAACVSGEAGVFDTAEIIEGESAETMSYEYEVEGYAWNDNLGFISFYCPGGENAYNPEPTNDGNKILEVNSIGCGEFEYGVKVGPASGENGPRELFGHAWSPTFGYIQFRGDTSVPDEYVGGYGLEDPYEVQQVIEGITMTITQVDSTTVNNVDGVNYEVSLEEEAAVDWAHITVKNLNTAEKETKKIFEGGSTMFWGLKVKLVETDSADGFSTVQFYNPSEVAGAPYGVTREPNGLLRGYAWSEAGIWIPMNGVKMGLPEEVLDTECDPDVEECEPCELFPDKPICIDIAVDGEAEVDAYEQIKVADGNDSYDMDFYLRANLIEDGVSEGTDFFDVYEMKLTFDWTDTVKKDQRWNSYYKDSDFSNYSSSLNHGGAVISKPTIFNLTSSNWNTALEKEGSSNHYNLKDSKEIRAYAPTSNANVSFSEAETGSAVFGNEKFVKPLKTEDATVWTNQITKNELVLNDVRAEVYPKGDSSTLLYEGSVLPPNKSKIELMFRPAIELKTLYSREGEDSIQFLHGVPIDFHGEVAENGALVAVGKRVQTKLSYTFDDEGCDASAASDYKFLFVGENLKPEEYYDSGSATKLLTLDSGVQTFNGVAVLPPPVEGQEGVVNPPCGGILPGPSIYSEISYRAGGVHSIVYYGNKLPRTVSYIENPSITVKGNIYAPRAFSSTADKEIQAVGNVSIASVRNSVNENVVDLLGGEDVQAANEGCTITSLGDAATVGCSGTGTMYKQVSVPDSDEKVLYFRGSDVVLGLSSNMSGKWAIVMDGGRLFIDDDVYSANNKDNRLAIAALKERGGSCKNTGVYVDNNVGNLQINLVTDCSMFAYDNVEGILESGAEVMADYPSLTTEEADRYVGLPVPPDTGFTNARKRLLIEGSIASKNTIGGADLDLDSEYTKDYILNGDGSVFIAPFSLDERKIARSYDLNYLRAIPLKFEYNGYGRIIDQSCGRGLTVDDIVKIQEGTTVAGPDGLCDGIGEGAYDPACDEECGDMILNLEDEVGNEVQGLESDDVDPVYVYYVKPDSFLFEEKGGVTSR